MTNDEYNVLYDLFKEVSSKRFRQILKDEYSDIYKEILKKHDLRFVYIGNYDEDCDSYHYNNGGMVICYSGKKTNYGKTPVNINVSVSACNPRDTFDKMVGKYIAAFRYDVDRVVPVRLNTRSNTQDRLRYLFQDFV